MIRGVHAMFYSSQAQELRAFLRDKLSLPFTDVGEGWLIFDAPEVEVGVHPADDSQPHAQAGTHDISFYCDDIERTVAGLKAKGVEFAGEVADHGYGLVTHFKLPGDLVVQLFQPRYKKSAKRPEAAARASRKKARKAAAPAARKAAGKKAQTKVAKKSKRRRPK